MKKFVVVLLAAVCVLSLVGCRDQEAEAAKEAAKKVVNMYYDIYESGLEDLYDFDQASHAEPTVNKVEKEADGRYVVTGTITGTDTKYGISKAWTADWKLTVEKNSDGEYKVTSPPTPDYGEIKYLD